MPLLHECKKMRKININYALPGNYFVTICTKNRINHFGMIKNGKMYLNEAGAYAQKCWINIPAHFPHISVGTFIIMPNHVHGLLTVICRPVGHNNYCALPEHRAPPDKHTHKPIPWQTKWAKTISSAIRGFKIGVTTWCKNHGYNDFAWQGSYYDVIVRDTSHLGKIQKYIVDNPSKHPEGN